MKKLISILAFILIVLSNNVLGLGTPTLSATTLTGFGNVNINSTAGLNTFTISGTFLDGTDVTVAALTGFTYGTSGVTYFTSLSILSGPGKVPAGQVGFSQLIYVKFSPTAVQSYIGNTATFTLGVTGATSVSGTNTFAGTGAITFTGDGTITGIWNETSLAACTFAGSLTNNASAFTANTGVHFFSGDTKTLSGTTTTIIGSITISGTYANTGTLTAGTALAGST
jgi:hypothetical protein